MCDQQDPDKHINHCVSKYGWLRGPAEMALGAALLVGGLQSGVIDMGSQMVASVVGGDVVSGMFAGGVASLGAVAGAVLTHCGTASIGVAALGSAVCVPGFVLMGAGTLLLGLAGHGAAELAAEFLQPVPGMIDLLGAGALMAGVTLLVRGAVRCATNQQVLDAASCVVNGAVRLGRVLADHLLVTLDELTGYLAEFRQDLGEFARDCVTRPQTAVPTAGLVTAGAVGGSAATASTVTVLGSHALGSAALSLGLVSAPVWPVVAGVGLGVAGAYGVWKALRGSGDRHREDDDESIADMF